MIADEITLTVAQSWGLFILVAIVLGLFFYKMGPRR